MGRISGDGNVRSPRESGGGYRFDVDTVACYVAMTIASGALIHETAFHRSRTAIEKTGIRAVLVPAAHS